MSSRKHDRMTVMILLSASGVICIMMTTSLTCGSGHWWASDD